MHITTSLQIGTMKDVGTYLCGFIVDNIESQGKSGWLVQERLVGHSHCRVNQSYIPSLL
jgi:hypothetical protein